jgi:tetratricopeptide (TPR) repeat protein/ADP-heptose:LPS heptosyltransferase
VNEKNKRRIKSYFGRKNFSGAEDLLKKLVSSNEKDLEARLYLAEVQVQLGDYKSASFHFSEVIKFQPRNTAALGGLGAALIRLGEFESAGTILEYSLSLAPNDIATRINYASILQSNGQHEAALKNAAAVISLDPTNPIAYNNIGSALFSLDFYADAIIAYETALTLDENYSDAAANIAGVAMRVGDFSKSIDYYRRALERVPSTAKHNIETYRFGLSAALLAAGLIEEGWKNYEFGFLKSLPASVRRNPLRIFDKPRWNGEDPKGRRILVWREQGLGDEILFFSCLPDLNKINCDVIVECDPRLVKPLQRSFPRFLIRNECIVPESMNSPFSDFDLQIPAGALPRIFRKNLDDFPKRVGFVRPAQNDRDEFLRRLSPYRGKKLVGICWRSGMLSAMRNRHYTCLADWSAAFSSLKAEVAFVNLQYGNCELEVSEFEKTTGIEIIRWQDIDLKNDLDQVMALISCLDAVITVGTAVVALAGAAGCKTVLIEPYGSFDLGATPGRYPWYPSVIKLCPRAEKTAASQIEKVPEVLRRLISAP